MRKYTKSSFEKLPYAEKIRQYPFPGMHPTRVLVEFTDGRVYFGKPYPGLYFEGHILRAREFDKAHLLLDASMTGPQRVSPAWKRYHSDASVYAPGTKGRPRSVLFASWLTHRWKIQRIKRAHLSTIVHYALI